MEPLPIFVYGTLQRGEERASCWPRPAAYVEFATTRGHLYDLGPYPALATGEDRVFGELWHLRARDMEPTLNALDAIECYGQDDVDLYVRRIVECLAETGQLLNAYAYFLADRDSLNSVQRVQPGEDGVCRWHRFCD